MDIQTSIPGLDLWIGNTTAQTVLDSEIPLPEGRIAVSVLSVFAELHVEETACVEDGVRASGRLTLRLLCGTDAGEPFGFTASSAFTHEMRLSGAQEGMQATVTGQLMECRCRAENGKVRLSAVLELNAAVTAACTVPLVTGITDCPGLEVQAGTIEHRRRVLLTEHTVRVYEEIAAPNAAKILLYRGAAEIRSLSCSGNSVSAEGSLYVMLLNESADGQLTTQSAILPFTDVFEAGYAPEMWAVAAVQQLSVVSADESFGVADVEALVQIRLYGVERTETSVLLDAYDKSAAFTCEQTALTVKRSLGAAQQRFSLRESVQIPPHLPEAYRPILAAAIPAVTGTFERDGRLGVDAMLFVTVLYQCDGGMLHSFTEDIPVQMLFDCETAEDVRVTLDVLSVHAAGGGRMPELQFTVMATAERYAEERILATSGVTPGGTEPAYQGVIVYCADAGDTLFSIGKRFLVPVQRILEWNGELKEPLAEGQTVLLLR